MTIDYLLEHPLVLLLALAAVVLGVGRLTRVITYDSYPPAMWLRSKWITLMKGNGWGKLADCFWCASPWVMAVALGWFFLTPLQPWLLWSWWIFWGWLSLAYVAAIILARDEPAAE